MTGNEGSVVSTLPSMSAVAGNAPSTTASQSPAASAAAKAAATAAAKKAQAATMNVKIAALSFFGLDKDGIPTGFSVTDANNAAGVARVTKGTSTVGADGIVINNQFITASSGPNVLIDQLLTVDGDSLTAAGALATDVIEGIVETTDPSLPVIELKPRNAVMTRRRERAALDDF